MSRHAAPRRRPRGGRVVLGLAALAGAVALGMGGAGTAAFWTDTGTVTPGTITSGTLDLQVDAQQGNPTAYVRTDLALDRMLPGESVARVLTVTNAGDAPFTFTQTTQMADDALSRALEVEVYAGGTASGNGTAYPRTGTCSGTLVASGQQVGGRLAPKTGSTTLCVRVSLPLTAPDAVQGQAAGRLTLQLDATQVLP